MLERLRPFARYALDVLHSDPTTAQRISAIRTLVHLDAAARRSRGGELIVNVMGHPMHGLDPGTMRGLFREIFLRQDYRCDFSDDAPVIVDCGANIGFAVLYFKVMFPRSTVYAFEPSPEAFRLLSLNIAANHLSDVKVFNTALSDRIGDI